MYSTPKDQYKTMTHVIIVCESVCVHMYIHVYVKTIHNKIHIHTVTVQINKTCLCTKWGFQEQV